MDVEGAQDQAHEQRAGVTRSPASFPCDEPHSRSTSGTGASWGQFGSFSRGHGASACAFHVQGAEMDEEALLFTPGMSTPQADDEESQSSLHKSPKEKDMASQGGARCSPTTSSSEATVTECMKCSAPPPMVFSYPCGCYVVCRKCAMKMATGGKSKICKNFYSSFTSTRSITAQDSDDSD